MSTDYGIETEVDRFDGSITWTAPKVELLDDDDEQFNVSLLASKIEEEPAPVLASFMFWHIGEDWAWMDHSDVIILANGVRYRPAHTYEDSKVIAGGVVLETVAAAFTTEDFARIASADQPEVRVGTQEFSLAGVVPSMRALWYTMFPAGSPATGASAS